MIRDLIYNLIFTKYKNVEENLAKAIMPNANTAETLLPVESREVLGPECQRDTT